MISGGAGNDLLVGGQGANQLTGGAGQDRFVIESGTQTQTIHDFALGQDQLVFYGFSDAAVIAAVSDYNQGVTDGIEFSDGTKVVLNGITAADVDMSDVADIEGDLLELSGVRSAPRTTAEIYAEHGKLGFLAMLSSAAYRLADHESVTPTLNIVNETADLVYQTVAGDLMLLGREELDGPFIGMPETTPIGVSPRVWNNKISSGEGNFGVFTNENAAALVGQSNDTLFVAFRGTNNTVDLSDGLWPTSESGEFDQRHWFTRTDHFELLKPLLAQLVSYLSEKAAAGMPLSNLVLTGHSLGAGMVQPAYEWLKDRLALAGLSVNIEGTTFASPGYNIGFDSTDNVNITNFWNAFDVINVAAYPSVIAGDGFTFNNAASALLRDGLSPTDSHSMDYYLEISRFLIDEGRKANWRPESNLIGLDISDLEFGLNGSAFDRISFTTQKQGDLFLIGERRDFIMAGQVEAVIGVASSVANEVITTFSDIVRLSQTSIAVVESLVTRTADSSYAAGKGLVGVGADLLAVGGQSIGLVLQKALQLLFVGELVIDYIKSLNDEDLVLGGDNDDVLMGLGGADVLFGGDGNDVLLGGSGNDQLYGGIGNDLLFGDSGVDKLIGGAGSDIYYLDDLGDVIFEIAADEGIDTVISRVSVDLDQGLSSGVENLILKNNLFLNANIFGGALVGTGNGLDNFIFGNSNNNTLNGQSGNDNLYGEGGHDTLNGGADNDNLYGGKGNDVLSGDSGNDILLGGIGRDTLEGGTGSDTFLFETRLDIAKDVITDFENGFDRIDIGGLASETTAGSFSWHGQSAVREAGSVWYRHIDGLLSGEKTAIFIHLDDGRSVDEQIQILGHVTLTQDDFIF